MKKIDIDALNGKFQKQTIRIIMILLVLLSGRLIAQPVVEYTPANFHTFVDDLMLLKRELFSYLLKVVRNI